MVDDFNAQPGPRSSSTTSSTSRWTASPCWRSSAATRRTWWGCGSTTSRPSPRPAALVPLDERMAQSGLKRDYYVENYLKLGEYGGHIYALPTSPATVALFYNKEHFRSKAKELRAAGLDPDRPPATHRGTRPLRGRAQRVQPRRHAGGHGLPAHRSRAGGTRPGGTTSAAALFDANAGRITADDEGNVKGLPVDQAHTPRRYGRRASSSQFRQGSARSTRRTTPSSTAGLDGDPGRVVPQLRPAPPAAHGVRRGAVPVRPRACRGRVSCLEADVIAIPAGAGTPRRRGSSSTGCRRRGCAILCRLQGKHMPVRELRRSSSPGPSATGAEVFETWPPRRTRSYAAHFVRAGIPGRDEHGLRARLELAGAGRAAGGPGGRGPPGQDRGSSAARRSSRTLGRRPPADPDASYDQHIERAHARRRWPDRRSPMNGRFRRQAGRATPSSCPG